MPPSIKLTEGNQIMEQNKPIQKHRPYAPPAVLVAWLAEGKGRAAHFQRVDKLLLAPIISKIKVGQIPVTFEYAIRLERAQMPSDNPFKADQIMTYQQDRALYRYITGQEPAPAYVPHVRATRASAKRAA